MAVYLLHNLLLFGRLLRGLGLDVDTGRMLDIVQALSLVNLSSKDDFYHTLRCILVRRREDLAVFDQAFARFWRVPLDEAAFGGRAGGELRRSRRPVITPPPLNLPGQESRLQMAELPDAEKPPVIQATLTYSQRELLRHKDFGELSAEELAAIQKLLASLVWQVGARRTRRFHAGKGKWVNLRQVLRRSLQNGGEVVNWSYRRPNFKPRSLVILADISGSMERYTRLLLHFAYSLSLGLKPGVETFLFSTRLTRVTRSLRSKDVERALIQVSQQVPDWSGGTRIGDALKRFNFDWGRRVLGHGAVVLLISDGWDCGDAALLRFEMARLQRSAFRLIWLNPLLGMPDYEPLTRGMQTALPFVDDFLPVHNLASLEDLAQRLLNLDGQRPERRQVLFS